MAEEFKSEKWAAGRYTDPIYMNILVGAVLTDGLIRSRFSVESVYQVSLQILAALHAEGYLGGIEMAVSGSGKTKRYEGVAQEVEDYPPMVSFQRLMHKTKSNGDHETIFQQMSEPVIFDSVPYMSTTDYIEGVLRQTAQADSSNGYSDKIRHIRLYNIAFNDSTNVFNWMNQRTLNAALQANGESTVVAPANADNQLRRAYWAFSSYAMNSRVERYSLIVLRCRDIPCVFEACWILFRLASYNDEHHTCSTHDNIKVRCEQLSRHETFRWTLELNIAFQNLPQPLRELALAGNVQPFITAFVQYCRQTFPFQAGGFDIGFFNSHRYSSEYERVFGSGAEDGSQDTQTMWWLVYEREHVFPLSVISLIEMVRQLTMQKQHLLGKERDVWDAEQQDDSMVVVVRTRSSYMQRQLEHFLQTVQEGEQTQDEVQGQFSKLVMEKGKVFDIYRALALPDALSTQCAAHTSGLLDCITRGAREEFFEQQLDKRRAYNRASFDKMGLLGLDIETFIDDEQAVSDCSGNFKPYMLCIYGRLQRMGTIKDGAEKKGKIVTDADINVAFVGTDCVRQFIDFLVVGGYAATRQCKTFAPHLNAGGTIIRNPKLKNVIVAHNGCKFDFRFLWEQIYAELGDFKMIGSVEQTKACEGSNLILLDTSLIIPGSLKNIARSFFPNEPGKQKFENDDIVSLTRSDFVQLDQARMESIQTYCTQDALVVYHIAESFFGKVFCEPINGQFFGKEFCYSSAQLSWSIIQNLFWYRDISVNKTAYEYERVAYHGGFTCCFKSQCRAGISIDINSSYPASMNNVMPFDYVIRSSFADNTPQVVLALQPTVLISPENAEVMCVQYVKPYNLYYLVFRFENDVLHPTLIIQRNGTLIAPLSNVGSTAEFNSPLRDSGDWCWGVEIIQALATGRCSVRLTHTIEYEPHRSHREFIEYFYAKRLEAKRSGDQVQDMFCKILMNSQYGKHGQKFFPTAVLGGISQMYDLYDDLEDDGYNVSFHPVNSQRYPLCQIKYHRDDDKWKQKGATVRFASYITALSRVNLMRAVKYAEEYFGAQSVTYCDTDSVYIDLSEYLTEEHLQEIKNSPTPFTTGMSLFEQHVPRFAEFTKLKTYDIRNVCSSEDIFDTTTHATQLLDDSVLGAYKIEQVLLEGVFMGAKQYTYTSYESGKNAREVSKLKGVPQMDREQFAYRQIFENFKTACGPELTSSNDITYQIASRASQPVQVSSVFKSMQTGVHIQPVLKIIQPTWGKREHYFQRVGDVFQEISFPFKTIPDFILWQTVMRANIQKNASKITELERERFDTYQETAAVKGFKLQTLKMSVQAQFEIQQKRLADERKRHRLRLASKQFFDLPALVWEKVQSAYGGEHGRVSACIQCERYRQRIEAILGEILQRKKRSSDYFDRQGFERGRIVQILVLGVFICELLRQARVELPDDLQRAFERTIDFLQCTNREAIKNMNLGNCLQDVSTLALFMNCTLSDTDETSLWQNLQAFASESGLTEQERREGGRIVRRENGLAAAQQEEQKMVVDAGDELSHSAEVEQYSEQQLCRYYESLCVALWHMFDTFCAKYPDREISELKYMLRTLQQMDEENKHDLQGRGRQGGKIKKIECIYTLIPQLRVPRAARKLLTSARLMDKRKKRFNKMEKILDDCCFGEKSANSLQTCEEWYALFRHVIIECFIGFKWAQRMYSETEELSTTHFFAKKAVRSVREGIDDEQVRIIMKTIHAQHETCAERTHERIKSLFQQQFNS